MRAKNREVLFRNLELGRKRGGLAEFPFANPKKDAARNDRSEEQRAIAFWDLAEPKPGPQQHSDQQNEKDQPGSPFGAAAELLVQIQRFRLLHLSIGAGIFQTEDW